MRVDSQRLAIRVSSKILVEYSPCPVEAILSAVIAVVTRFRTQKTRKPERNTLRTTPASHSIKSAKP